MDSKQALGCLLRSDLANYGGASNLMFNEKITNLMKAGKKVYHLGFGQSPFPVIETAVEALKDNAGVNAYLPVAGIPELRAAISRFHARYDGMTDIDPDDILVGPGSKLMIFLNEVVFQGVVMLLSPSWTTYRPQITLTGHKAIVISTDQEHDWKVTPDMIEKAVHSNNLTGNKLFIFNNPDNPTGTCYDENELRALSDVFRKYNIIVVSDEIYARLHYTQGHVSLAKFYPEGTILSTGLSKWASAGGWRVGYHIYPKELSHLKEAVKNAASHTYSCAPAPMQYAAVNMLNNEEAVDSYIRHTARIMAAVADYCYSELTSVGVKVTRSKAGYYILPDFDVIRASLARRGIRTGREMCAALLEEASVALMAAGPEFLRPVDELTTRLCYVNFDGSEGLAYSRKLGLDTPLPGNFVKEYCAPLYEGIQALKNWVLAQLND